MALQSELEELAIAKSTSISEESMKQHVDSIRESVTSDLDGILEAVFVEKALTTIFIHMSSKWEFDKLKDMKMVLSYLFEFTDDKQKKGLFRYLEKTHPDLVWKSKREKEITIPKRKSPTTHGQSPPELEGFMKTMNVGDFKSCSCPTSPRNKKKNLGLKFRLSASLLPKFTWELNSDEVQVQYKIGEGSFGEVYYGLYNNKPVAIKRLAHMEGSEKSLMNEMSVLCRLDNPNVIKFIGAILGSSIGIVTRYEKNRDLLSFLKTKKGKKLKPRQRFKMALEMINGISYLHSNKIIHGDIKSSNILVSKRLHCKLSDFGISHRRGKETYIMNELGTLAYLAPELIRGDVIAPNVKTDVYSLGMTLYELFESKVPFQGLSSLDIIRSVDENSRPIISSKCPKDIAALIRRCWNEDTDVRPSMEEMEKIIILLLEEDDSDSTD